MPRVIFQVGEEERRLYVQAAHRELVTLSEWLRRAAEVRLNGVVGGGAGRLPQGAAGETPPDPLLGATATDTSQGREVTPEGELKNEAPTRAYSTAPAENTVKPSFRKGGQPDWKKGK